MKIQEAFTYVFKEKNAAKKVMIAFGFSIVLFLSSLMVVLLTPSRTLSPVYPYSYRSEPFSVFALVGICVFCLAFIVYLFGYYWFFYESAKAVFEKRETELLTDKPFNWSLKRSGKLFLMELVYGIVVVALLACVMCLGFLLLSAGIGAASSSRAAASGFGVGVILFMCLILCIVLPLSLAFQYLVLDPSRMRLIYTDTFGEGLKLSENFKYAWNNLSKIGTMILVEVGLIFVYFIISFVVGLVVGIITTTLAINGGNTVLMSIISQLISLPLTLVSIYYSFIVRPNFVARYYKEIFEKKS